jgi:hypothetical protein
LTPFDLFKLDRVSLEGIGWRRIRFELSINQQVDDATKEVELGHWWRESEPREAAPQCARVPEADVWSLLLVAFCKMTIREDCRGRLESCLMYIKACPCARTSQESSASEDAEGNCDGAEKKASRLHDTEHRVSSQPVGKVSAIAEDELPRDVPSAPLSQPQVHPYGADNENSFDVLSRNSSKYRDIEIAHR